jgi:hypothetical protein
VGGKKSDELKVSVSGSEGRRSEEEEEEDEERISRTSPRCKG